ncbi:MAG: HEPN family nuclease [Anaerolineae bacterium]|nr:HEPN family nuclease [Anaerolineae bacterium]
MDYNKEIVQDFAQRTLQNLEFIEQKVKDDPDAELYEVTQLINSLLGLVVFPQQHFYEKVPETPLEKLAECGWPDVKTLAGDPPVAHLKELTRYMRNAIAHFNIQFTADENPPHEITGVKLWNSNRNGDFWQVQLPIKAVRQIAIGFVDLLRGDIDCATPSTDRSR